MTAETPRPPNDSLYSLQPTRPLSVVIFRKSKLRPPASAWRCSTLAIFMNRLLPVGRGTGRPEAEHAEDPGVVERELAQRIVAAGGAAVAGRHVDLEQQRRARAVFSARSLATHLAGSQYITWLSLSEVRTRMAG